MELILLIFFAPLLLFCLCQGFFGALAGLGAALVPEFLPTVLGAAGTTAAATAPFLPSVTYSDPEKGVNVGVDPGGAMLNQQIVQRLGQMNMEPGSIIKRKKLQPMVPRAITPTLGSPTPQQPWMLGGQRPLSLMPTWG